MSNTRAKLRGPEIQYESEDEKLLISKAASMQGLNVSSFVKSQAIQGAREIIRSHNTTYVSEQAWDSLMDMMESPPEPNEELKNLHEEHAASIKDLQLKGSTNI